MNKLDNQPQHFFQEEESAYPQGEALKRQINGRNRRGLWWRVGFMAALSFAIVCLVALMVTIVNDTFGYVIMVSTIDPDRLALEVVQNQMLTAADTFSSEDDNELAAGIAADPNGIGFFGNAYYQQNSDKVKLLAVEGLLPDEETALSGAYALDRPLFLYTTADILAENLAANGFINYLLTHINEEIEQVGYLPTSQEDLNYSQQNWIKANPDVGYNQANGRRSIHRALTAVLPLRAVPPSFHSPTICWPNMWPPGMKAHLPMRAWAPPPGLLLFAPAR